MVVFGVLLGLAEYYGRQRVDLQQLKVTDGVVLGFAQACALIPGVSRSGGTITAGLFLGLKREAAVRYSFLLAIPAVVAAGVFTIPDIAKGGITPVQMIVATVIAFIVGFAMIAWLLRWVAKHTVYVFVWYRIALGALLFVALGVGWCPRPNAGCPRQAMSAGSRPDRSTDRSQSRRAAAASRAARVGVSRTG